MKSLWTSIGFIVFILGMMALVLSLVGIKFAFLTFIDAPGATFGFVVKLAMILGGIVIIVLAQTDWKADQEELL